MKENFSNSKIAKSIQRPRGSNLEAVHLLGVLARFVPEGGIYTGWANEKIDPSSSIIQFSFHLISQQFQSDFAKEKNYTPPIQT